VSKMGRPPAAMMAINKEELEKIMHFFPSRKETADWFKISESSLERFIRREFDLTFEAFRDKGFVRTKMAIKRKQIEMALSGDRTMLIWLGKQLLGQTEKIEQTAQESIQVIVK